MLMPIFVESILILSLLIIVARFLKRGSIVLQRLFIPSALIAGVGGLVFGPQVLDTIPTEITNFWATMPKFLINIVFAGLFLGKKLPTTKEIWRLSGPMIAFGNTIAWGQYVLGLILTIFILTPLFGVNPLAGGLIEIGFEGGHGTAAGLAPSFDKLGWSQGTDIALVLATVSLLAAILSGVILINWHNRRYGYTISKKAWQRQRRELIRSGYNLVRFGDKINANPVAILRNVFALVVAIAIGYGLLYGLTYMEAWILGTWTDLRFMPYVPLFPFAMIGGLILQLILRKAHMQHLLQRHTIQVISTIALDLLIASAIATISLKAVTDNLPVVIVLSLAGIVWILGCFLLLAPRMFPSHWFEQGITNTGQSMGMTATGLLMNRLADPANKSHAKEGFAYKQLIFEPFMGGGLVTATAIIVIYELGAWFALITATIFMVFWLTVGLLFGKFRKK